MSLSAGDKLGPYEILAPLGAGGMGEVYKARDRQLEREVAIKVLPQALARDPERLARFDREAKSLAALNHPNIAVIYGMVESSGQKALAMELVPGDTLGARIKRGAMPIQEALQVAKQMAEAIEAAHEKGITHRDLKPGNVMITPAGVVKVLDFGLAAIVPPSSSVNPDNSPTLTMGMTQTGTIMGTASYMSPEQAEGEPVDKRADIWSFGVVLWEMLTGKRLFEGKTVSRTLASVLQSPIEFDQLTEPAPVKRLLRRCLERDQRNRLRDIGEARFAIQEYLANPASEPENSEQVVPPPSRVWPAATAVVTLALLGVSAWTFYPRPTPPTTGAIRFTFAPPEGATLTATNAGATQQAMSPDGKYVAFIADETGKERTLWVRALSSLSAQKLDKTDGAGFPFWSPDSQHIAFFADSQVKRIPMSGGSPTKVADAGAGNGGTWFQDASGEGTIVFAADGNSPLQRVPASGGVATPFTKLAEGETAHSFPQFLPDGKRVLYWARGGSKLGMYVQALGSEERTFVRETPGRAVFSPPNFLLFLMDGTLMAQHFDPASLKVEGEPVSVAHEVRHGSTNGRSSFSVSSNGVVVYRSGGGDGLQLTWYSRDGKPAGVALPAGPNGPIELSPDDQRVTVERGGLGGAESDLWLLELATGVFSRLTSSPGLEVDAVWAPDSHRIAFSAPKDIRETTIGSGKEAIISADRHALEDWTRDGKQLLIRNNTKVLVIPAPQAGESKATENKPRLVLDVPFNVDQLRVSPDGKWVAYMSRESGNSQVNVATFPSFTNRRQISTSGGMAPLWRADGKELFFRFGSRVMAVDVKPGATFETGPIRTLFQGSSVANATAYTYAVTRDGQRFLMLETVGNTNVHTTVEPLFVIANWPALVK